VPAPPSRPRLPRIRAAGNRPTAPFRRTPRPPAPPVGPCDLHLSTAGPRARRPRPPAPPAGVRAAAPRPPAPRRRLPRLMPAASSSARGPRGQRKESAGLSRMWSGGATIFSSLPAERLQSPRFDGFSAGAIFLAPLGRSAQNSFGSRWRSRAKRTLVLPSQAEPI
jgi:hypothetical protein